MVMSSRSRFAIVAVLVAIGSGRAGAVAPEIKDDAKLFSADTLKKANDELREIYTKYGRDFLMETFGTPPADQAEKVKTLQGKEKSDFFTKWALSRVKERAVNGVYVLFCKEPKFMVVGVTRRARSVLSSQDRKKIDEIIRQSIGEKKPDEGLLAAIKYTRERLSSSK
jgi:hypothetical protein